MWDGGKLLVDLTISRVQRGRVPFTVFTKTCFSLLGSFSSSSTPWKMRPNVPVKDKKHRIVLEEKGQERHSQRHRIQRSKCHLAHRPPCLADLWTEVDRFMLKMLLSPNGIRQFWLSSRWQEPKREIYWAQRTFHRRERFRNTYDVEKVKSAH